MFTFDEQLCLDMNECNIEVEKLNLQLHNLSRHQVDFVDGVIPDSVTELAKTLFGEDTCTTLEGLGSSIIAGIKFVAKKILALIKRILARIFQILKLNNAGIKKLLTTIASKNKEDIDVALANTKMPKKEGIYEMLQIIAYINTGIQDFATAASKTPAEENDVFDALALLGIQYSVGRLFSAHKEITDPSTFQYTINTYLDKTRDVKSNKRGTWTSRDITDVLTKLVSINKGASSISMQVISNKVNTIVSELKSDMSTGPSTYTLLINNLLKTTTMVHNAHSMLLVYLNRPFIRVVNHAVTGN